MCLSAHTHEPFSYYAVCVIHPTALSLTGNTLERLIYRLFKRRAVLRDYR